ncbi:MAG: hypothetical protein M0033_10075 [Nitrospiraceae bacterium]|nr:hypothetical protein [Nitrospiraceae bacterium]
MAQERVMTWVREVALLDVVVTWIGEREGSDKKMYPEFQIRRQFKGGRQAGQDEVLTISGNGVKIGEKLPLLVVNVNVIQGRDGRLYQFYRKPEKS